MSRPPEEPELVVFERVFACAPRAKGHDLSACVDNQMDPAERDHEPISGTDAYEEGTGDGRPALLLEIYVSVTGPELVDLGVAQPHVDLLGVDVPLTAQPLFPYSA